MRELIRKVLINTLSLFIVSLFLTGLKIEGGISSYFLAGVSLTVFAVFLDPLIKLVTLPFNILTLGLLSFLTTLAALFITALFFKNVHVTNFTVNSFSVLGISFGNISVSGLLPYIVISATIYFLAKLLNWVFS